MSAVVIIVVLVLALVVLPRLAGAAASAPIEYLMGGLWGAKSRRRRVHATFVTSLSESAAAAAAIDAARSVGASGAAGSASLPVGVIFSGGGRLRLSAQTDTAGRLRIHISPSSPVLDEASMARFRGALLASLRERDPGTQQV